jgi:hypothetical protein
MKTIDVTVATDGGVAIEAQGFSGPDCELATAFLERALGRTAKRRRKPEFARRTTAQRSAAR